MEQPKFPFEEMLLNMKAGDEEVLWIKERAFIIALATEDDIERVGKGHFCLE